MGMYAGLDVGGKTTAICVMNEAGKIVRQEGVTDTHRDAIAARLRGFQAKLVKLGIESAPFTPHLHRSLSDQSSRGKIIRDGKRGTALISAPRVNAEKEEP